MNNLDEIVKQATELTTDHKHVCSVCGYRLICNYLYKYQMTFVRHVAKVNNCTLRDAVANKLGMTPEELKNICRASLWTT